MHLKKFLGMISEHLKLSGVEDSPISPPSIHQLVPLKNLILEREKKSFKFSKKKLVLKGLLSSRILQIDYIFFFLHKGHLRQFVLCC